MAENWAGATSEAVDDLRIADLDFIIGVDISLHQIDTFMNIADAAIETLKRNLLDEHEEPKYIRDTSVNIVEGLQEIFSEVKGRVSDIAKNLSTAKDELGGTPF